MSTIKDNIPQPVKPKTSILLWTTVLTLAGIGMCAGRFFYLTQKASLLKQETLVQAQDSFKTETLKNINLLQIELEKMNKPDPKNTDLQWSLHQALYAIQLAQLNAKWGQNINTTLALLQQADLFLAQHNHAELFPIRQALAHEIAEAEATPVIDTPGILSQLDALQRLTSDYTFTKPMLQTQAPVPKTPSSTSSTWRDRLHTTLLSFKQFFVIRHHDSPLEPLLSPAYQTAQKEIIRLNLEEAAWAVLEKNDAMYQRALRQTRENMIRAFGESHEQLTSMLKQLQTLQTITLHTQTFVPHESLPLLESMLNAPSTQTGASS